MRRTVLYLAIIVGLFMSGYNKGYDDSAMKNGIITKPLESTCGEEAPLENRCVTPFEGIMGLDGFYDTEYEFPYFSIRTYYGIFGEYEKYMYIGESYGFDEPEDYIVDIDGDGITELLCNCVTGASTHSDLYVYKLSKEGILKGHVVWTEDDLPGLMYWGNNAVQNSYDPANNDVKIVYYKGETDETVELHFGFDIIEFENLGFQFLNTKRKESFQKETNESSHDTRMKNI